MMEAVENRFSMRDYIVENGANKGMLLVMRYDIADSFYYC